MTDADKSRKTLPRLEVRWDHEGKKKPSVPPTIIESEIARLAISLVGTLANVPDGDTSSGHQRWRVATPQEIAERSIAIAEYMVSELENRGHVVFLPPHDEWPGDGGPIGFMP